MSGRTQRAQGDGGYARWLVEYVTRAELLGRVRDLFDRCGPALPRSLRGELDLLIDEQVSRTLAQCVALNERPEDDDAFLDCTREADRESTDPYIRHGMRRRDFL